MRNRWTVALFLLGTVIATGADAQQSRAELLRQAREEKQKTLEPYEANAAEKVLGMIERQGVPLITRDRVYLKFGSITTGSGFSIGGGYRSRRLFERDGVLDVWGAFSMSRYWAVEGRMRTPSVYNGRLSFESYGRRHEYPEEDFFGIGPASGTRRHAEFNLMMTAVGTQARIQPTRGVTFGGGVEYLDPFVTPSRTSPLPPIGSVFDPPSVPGLISQPDYWKSSGFVDLDWRRPVNARNGGWYRAEVSRYSGDSGQHSFSRLDVDLRQWVSFFSERRVLFGRAKVSTSDADTNHTVPFYLMPTLGGNDSLRGFRDYRFRGPHALLVQGEYRFEIWSGLDAALFYDAGKVALTHSDLNFRDLEHDYGVGFRFNTDRGLVLRVDGAFGSRDGKHLWIVFGGTF
jgi:hypothetical protein